jgi:prolyl-tRNA synthetase
MIIGTPIRIEIGPKDLDAGEVKLVRRCDGQKKQLKFESLVSTVNTEFEDIHATMYNGALAKFEESKATASDMKEFMNQLNNKKMILTPWCDNTACEKKVKEMSGMLAKADETEKEMSGSAKTLCKPLEQQPVPEGTKCFAHEYCKSDAKVYCFWGRSY